MRRVQPVREGGGGHHAEPSLRERAKRWTSKRSKSCSQNHAWGDARTEMGGQVTGQSGGTGWHLPKLSTFGVEGQGGRSNAGTRDRSGGGARGGRAPGAPLGGLRGRWRGTPAGLCKATAPPRPAPRQRPARRRVLVQGGCGLRRGRAGARARGRAGADRLRGRRSNGSKLGGWSGATPYERPGAPVPCQAPLGPGGAGTHAAAAAHGCQVLVVNFRTVRGAGAGGAPEGRPCALPPPRAPPLDLPARARALTQVAGRAGRGGA